MSHPETSATAEPGPSDDLLELQSLPKEVGVLLLVIGTGGVLLPGPVGTPFLIMGGVVLWPRLFSKVESSFERRFPRAHRHSMRQLHRFIHDLENRYPTTR
ncbi:MAG: hypothetical protein U0835_18540 [Isosphaeraceae bacterium]